MTSKLFGKELHIDGAAGAAGDMLLGAFLDLGVPRGVIADSFDAVSVGAERLKDRKISKQGILACNVNIAVESSSAGHRHFSSIREQIENSKLEHSVKSLAIRIFTRLAEAEAHLHSSTLDAVHFHEVGALDAIGDIVGAAAAVSWLSPRVITASPLCVGEGMVKTEHGRLPVPAPATLEILRNVSAPIRGGGAPYELCTPTGAAILAEIVVHWSGMPDFQPLAIGYGAGDLDLPDRPNVLRLTVGGPLDSQALLQEEEMLVGSANIDDMNPELFTHIEDVLKDAGAVDVWWASVGMKKGRPGTEVSFLAPKGSRTAVSLAVMRETTTLGVRFTECKRLIAKREVRMIATEFGPVAVKFGTVGDDVVNVAPEYEACREVARATGVPVKIVYSSALSAGLQTR